jgi:SAM-dependent methyltransferase
MSNTSRVDKSLIDGGHYLGKPADANDLLVKRRIRLVRGMSDLIGVKGLDFLGKDKTLVEIGCGNGNTFDALQRELGVENAEFQVWDIMGKAFEPAADRLISFEVIEHLPGEEGVANYAKSLKLGGLAAISVPNKWWIFETHGAKLPLLPWNRIPFFGWLPRPLHERWSHARTYTKRRICKLLELHGFEILTVEYITAPMDVVKWPPLQNFLRRWVFSADTTKVPFKAVSILVTCKRIR